MMEVAKGKTLEDGTYLYTCGKCRGKGELYGGEVCDWCYALDLDKCRYAFKVARGKQYYSLLKAILSIIGKQMVDKAKELRGASKHGGLRAIDLAYIALHFDLNFKCTVEWLEETHCLKSGAYLHIMDIRVMDDATQKQRKVKVADLYALARKEYGLPEPTE